MTVTYTTADKVIGLLRLYDPSTATRWADSTTSDPTTAEVELWINWAEDYLDKAIGHAYRTTTVTEESHDIFFPWNGFYAYEIGVPLKHRSIATIDENEGDAIEIRQSNEWIDLASTASYTEGLDEDYWVDCTNGILYLVKERPTRKDHSVRVTYRFGEAAVPGDIEEAATKMACIKLIESDWYKVTIPQGPDMQPVRSNLPKVWREDIKDIIANRKEILSF